MSASWRPLLPGRQEAWLLTATHHELQQHCKPLACNGIKLRTEKLGCLGSTCKGAIVCVASVPSLDGLPSAPHCTLHPCCTLHPPGMFVTAASQLLHLDGPPVQPWSEAHSPDDSMLPLEAYEGCCLQVSLWQRMSCFASGCSAAQMLPNSDCLQVPVLYPFGHGLSYSSFDYQKLRVTRTRNSLDTHTLAVVVRVKNTGERAGLAGMLCVRLACPV